MNIPLLAVLSNQLGGDDAVANELGVDVELVQQYLDGARLTRTQRATLNRAFADFELNQERQDELDLDLTETEDWAQEVGEIMASDFGGDSELEQHFIDALRQGHLTERDFIVDETEHIAPIDVFKEITLIQAEYVLEFMRNNPVSDFLDLYVQDRRAGYGLWENVEKSAFWEWFRSEFYGD